jgi:hypothetical protein
VVKAHVEVAQLGVVPPYGAEDSGLTLQVLDALAAGHGHLNLDGTVVLTDRCSRPGSNGADLWWSGKHKHHGGKSPNARVPC